MEGHASRSKGRVIVVDLKDVDRSTEDCVAASVHPTCRCANACPDKIGYVIRDIIVCCSNYLLVLSRA